MQNKQNVLVIAEAGVNHNGSLETALKLVDVAKEAGADIVKFQTAKAECVASKFAEKAEYQKANTGASESQLDMIKKLLLTYDEFEEVKRYCDKVGIEFLSTPFDLPSIDFLSNLGCKTWKIPSGEITNYPYLVKIAKKKEKVILSTGMSTLDEIQEAIDILTSNGTTDITLLHCTTDYPTPIESVNLNAMKTIESEFGYPVGYSDHTEGIAVDIAAVAMGATVIEKHFTLDRTMPGPDHKASLEPNELKVMVSAIRKIEVAKGSFEKKPTEAELENRKVARKSIVASRDIKKGETFSEDNITTKRPGTGISPMKWKEIIGQVAKRDYSEDEIIEE